MKKKIFFPALLIFGLIMFSGCSRVSLTGTTNQGALGPDGASMGTPPDGGTPPEGQTPPDGNGAPMGGPSEAM